MWAPRRIRAPSILTVHMLFSNPTVEHPSFAREALMVVCQALAAGHAIKWLKEAIHVERIFVMSWR